MTSPHQGQRVVRAGVPLEAAKAAMVLLHGRGASAENILELARELAVPGFAYLAPQAANYSWYPNSFLAPIESNEPGISSGISAVGDVVKEIQNAGLSSERIILLGFSQGACLALEFAARNARRWGGIAALSGGLIGPEGTPREYQGSLQETTVFLGCSEVDPHIPKARVIETAQAMKRLGGDVTLNLYPNMGHTVNRDEIKAVAEIMESVVELTSGVDR